MKLHIDVETYSSVDIRTSGAYKYCESVDFEILMVAFAFDDRPVKIIDLMRGEKLPDNFIAALMDPNIEKHAHNANFERNAFRAIGYDVPIEQWHCSAVKSAYCGLPLSLDGVSQALKLGDKGKLSTGKKLIETFSVPIRPTKANEFRRRWLPDDKPEEWIEFKTYCIGDVIAEREIGTILDRYEIPDFERDNYILDQEVNDSGIAVDMLMANRASTMDDEIAEVNIGIMKTITGVENPNSPKQLKKWLSGKMHKEIKSLAKEPLEALISEAKNGYWVDDAGDGLKPRKIKITDSSDVLKVLILRTKTGKSSTKKYVSMENCVCYDGRVHGLFQFYGANRTGRWAGRLVQLQNLPRNEMDETVLDDARKLVVEGNTKAMLKKFDNVADTLSQLIRTAFIAGENKTFAIADFSAIEARVTAWLAGEKWRIDIFNTHGKIYEASASKMFGVPIEEIDKGSELRGKGKIAELALGYQGAVAALQKMGGEKMGLSENEMAQIVKAWRSENKNIVDLWKYVNLYAVTAVEEPNRVFTLKRFQGLKFKYDGNALMIELPSGRKLFYYSAKIVTNRFGSKAVAYRGIDQTTKKWWWIESYGGKFVENIVQAVSRDVLAYSMQRLRTEKFKIVMHVHDEVVAEITKINAQEKLDKMCEIMGEEIPWAPGLPNRADGYLTDYYKKD